MRNPGSEHASFGEDLRRAFAALLATAIGTFAGIVVDSGFTVREAVLHPVYWVLAPMFDLFSGLPNTQLVAAGVVDRMPVTLIVGLGAGLLLRALRYPRMLLVATTIWPACAMARKAAMALFPGTDAVTAAASNSLLPELAIYIAQYAILIAIIRVADRAVRRQDPVPALD